MSQCSYVIEETRPSIIRVLVKFVSSTKETIMGGSDDEGIVDEKSPLITAHLRNELAYLSSDSIDGSDGEHHYTHLLSSQHEILIPPRLRRQSSTTSIRSIMTEFTEDHELSLALTVCNIMPILQGSSVFGLPYAVMVGGMWFLPIGIIICLLAEIASSLLIDCLYDGPPTSYHRRRVNGSYAEVAHSCWGEFGSKVVDLSNFIIYFMNNVVNVALLGRCVYNMLHTYTKLTSNHFTIIFSIAIVPFLFVRKLSVLAIMGLVSSLAVFGGCIGSLVIFIKCSSVWSSNYNMLSDFNLDDSPLATGILLYSVLLAPTLPNIEESMRKKHEIYPAMRISFTCSTIFKMAFGTLGVLTFGYDTKQLVANNVIEFSIVLRFIVCTMLALYAICNTAYFCYMINVMTDDVMVKLATPDFVTKPKYRIPWIIISRLFWLVAMVVVGLVMPFFALVSGAVGALMGSFTCLIAPVIFHLMLKWNELSTLRRSSETALLLIVIFIGGSATYTSVRALVLAIKEQHNL